MEHRELDRIDCDLLGHLQNDARITNKELASRVGLAPSTCLERVRRLAREGYFRGFHAEVIPQKLGIGLQAMIAVRMGRHSRDRVEEFRAYALSLPEVRDLYHVAGENDFLVHVAVRDADHLRDLVLSAFTTREELSHTETSLVFEHVRRHVLPNYRQAAE